MSSPNPVVLPGLKVDKHGETPLHKACSSGDVERVRQLLERTKDHAKVAYCNYTDFAGNTSMHKAALKGHLEVIKLLVSYGAEVSPVNEDNDTPLNDAYDNEHAEVQQYLETQGAQRTKSDGKRTTKPKRSALFEKMDYSSLLKACQEDDTQKVGELIEVGIKPTHDCVVAAIQAKSDTLLDVLFAFGAPVDNLDNSGKTPLVYAIECGNWKAVRLLLDNGADAKRNWPVGSKSYYHDHVRKTSRGRGWEDAFDDLRAIVRPEKYSTRTRRSALTTEVREMGLSSGGNAGNSRLTAELGEMDVAERAAPPEPPNAIRFGLENPLPYLYPDFEIPGKLSLWDIAPQLYHFPRNLVDENPPNPVTPERWMAGYQVSLILGHSHLATLKTVAERRHAGEQGPATLPMTLQQRMELVWRPPINFAATAFYTRKWEQLTEWNGGGVEAVVAAAEAEGFKGLKVLSNGDLSIMYKPMIAEAQDKWEKMLAGEQLFWVRADMATALIEEEKGRQERLRNYILNTQPYCG
ncbi:MAG: hypothetical protein Q9159_004650 [Coniocarpon cinnabarinum]